MESSSTSKMSVEFGPIPPAPARGGGRYAASASAQRAARPVGGGRQTRQVSGTAKTSRDATQRGHGNLSLNRGSSRCMILREGKVEIGNPPLHAITESERRKS
jgi:hypothetical protein